MEVDLRTDLLYGFPSYAFPVANISQIVRSKRIVEAPIAHKTGTNLEYQKPQKTCTNGNNASHPFFKEDRGKLASSHFGAYRVFGLQAFAVTMHKFTPTGALCTLWRHQTLIQVSSARYADT